MSDWNAEQYHRLSTPQLAWGRAVLDRLDARPGERILDVGCGTGRLTAEIASATGSFTVGLDCSAAMLAEAVGHAGPVAAFVRGDGARLPFVEAFDAVFSGATFHWIPDHDRLFGSIYQALRPGGRLVAQCGGGPNLRCLLDRAHVLMDSAEFTQYFGRWTDPWRFAGPDETRARLAGAGFSNIETSLEPAPTTLSDRAGFEHFISCVCVRHHVDCLPSGVRPRFVGALADFAAGDDPPFTLDYWRLNMAARKDAA
jgi:SAM-dependent methyltransferase